jgi:hypothetical protein
MSDLVREQSLSQPGISVGGGVAMTTRSILQPKKSFIREGQGCLVCHLIFVDVPSRNLLYNDSKFLVYPSLN